MTGNICLCHLAVLLCTVLSAVTASSTSPTSSTKSITSMATTAPTTVATTLAPKFGVSCDNDSWCNESIAGEAECSNKTCVCKNGHFKFNETVCFPDTDLIPESVNVSVNSTNAIVMWRLKASVANLNISAAVSAKRTDSSNWTDCTVDLLNRTATCTLLSPGELYSFTVNVSYISYPAVSVSQTISVNESLYPGIPGGLTSFNKTAPNVTLSWNASQGRVEYYSVTLNTYNSRNTTNNSTQIQFTNLTAGTNYNVTIQAYSYEKKSDNHTSSFRTLSGVPGPPTDLTLVHINETSLMIQWTRTSTPNGDILAHKVCLMYKVYNDEGFSGSNCSNTTTNTNDTFTAYNLMAGAFYNISVYTVNDYTESIPLSKEYRANQSTPGVVDNLRLDPGDVYINVTWSRPQMPHGDITGYEVKWEWLNNSAPQNCTISIKFNMSTSQVPPCDGLMEPPKIAVNQRNLEYKIEHLSPVTTYSITVIAITAVGPGEPLKTETNTTVAVPMPVTDVNLTVQNATAVLVEWTIPAVDPGPVNYTATAADLIFGNMTHSCTVTGYRSSNCTVTGLEAFWPYSVSVVGRSSAGSSSPMQAQENVTTKEGTPGTIQNYNAIVYDYPAVCDATKFTFYWEEPDILNRKSNITEYVFEYLPTSFQTIHFAVQQPEPYRHANQKFSLNLTGLWPQTNFTITVYAVSSYGLQGEPTQVFVSLGACAPPPWDDDLVDKIASPAATPESVTIRLPLGFFEKTAQGNISEKGLVVIHSKSDYYEDKNLEASMLGKFVDWQKAQSNNFLTDYKIILSSHEMKMSEHLDIQIGQVCTDSDMDSYCNGPLPEKFTFKVVTYACTEHGQKRCTVSKAFGPFQTSAKPEEASNAWIIPVAILIVLGVVVAAFGFLWYRGIVDPKKWLPGKRDDDFTTLHIIDRKRPIPLVRFSEEVEELHKDSNLRFSDQYDDINKLGLQFQEKYPCDASRLESNTPKNRWVNILPFDHTRVKLQQVDNGDPTPDYINANFIPGFNNMTEYIATQGPLPGTIDDFWRMVWEHNVSVIVMLTQCKEGGKVKCEKYWPDEVHEPKQYGEVVVNPVSMSTLDKYNISIFNVSVNTKTRQVHHFHYLDFPDFSADVEYDHFITFVQTVRSHVPRDMTGPMVIHCSAGVGRTGTFIIIDRLNLYLNSDKFNEEDSVDIYGMVVELREHRVLMVQTESQFIMIHDCFDKLLEDKREQLSEVADNLYENQSFDPFPEVLYENVKAADKRTEL